ncbi:MAG: hypothetical protein R2843_07565 [Thermomicrobiales bacterium]
MPALAEQLFEHSPHTQVDVPAEDTAAVVMGLDVDFTYAKLKAGAMAVRNGARFIATNTDATFRPRAWFRAQVASSVPCERRLDRIRR